MTANVSRAPRSAGQADITRRMMVALAFGLVFLTGALVVDDRNVGLGLWSIVAGIAVYVLWCVMRSAGGTRASGAQSVLHNVIEHDPALALLTDADGVVLDLNAAASLRLAIEVGDGIGDGFSAVFANPESVLFSLFGKARENGGGAEDVITRSGRFRISVTSIDQARYLWRIEGDAAVERQPNTAAAAPQMPMMAVGNSGAVLFVNEACRELLGGRPKSCSEVFGDAPLRSGVQRTLTTENGPIQIVLAVIDSVAGRKEVFLIPAQDSSDSGPRELNAGWNAIEDLPVPLLKISSAGTILASNREARTLLDLKAMDGKRLADVLDGLGRPICDWIKEAVEGRGGFASQFLRGRGDNHDTFVQVTLNSAGGLSDPHLIAVLNDVTELKTLEAQFVQSQKMQAIGQLAGGVAHDFNNLLTAISGHCDLLLLRHDQGDQDYGDLIQIHQNANRAASLVGQLLAFSRKQNLQPEVIDVRETLSDLTHLLNRLVGERVSLVLSLDQDLDPIKADKRQLEQVLMNLVVNARDAMPHGGEIDIMTENVHLDTPLQQDRASVPPGDYVVLRVKDEGEGIAPDKIHQIFEPFFTTKKTGEGTGLGLSTVYGIVKQTGGFIFAHSEIGTGTIFTLWFPMHSAQVSQPNPEPKPIPQMSETVHEGVILLVEDEAPVRAFASRALRLRGYTVLEADCAEAALTLLSDTELKIDVFVTDVIMPGLDGPTWVRQALVDRPEARVVFVSGYAEDAFGDEGPEVENAVFLPKPFSLNDLTQTVQAQLELAQV